MLVHKHKTGNTVSRRRNPVFQVIECRSNQPASQPASLPGEHLGPASRQAGSHRGSFQRLSSLERIEERVDAMGIHTSLLLLRFALFLFPHFPSPPSYLIDRSTTRDVLRRTGIPRLTNRQVNVLLTVDNYNSNGSQ